MARKLFQHARMTIADPDTGKEYSLFLSGATDMSPEVFNRIFSKHNLGQVLRDQEISPPVPFEDSAAYTEFKDFVEVLAEEMEEANS